MERGFLGLMAIDNQSADQIDQKVERTAMAGVFDLGNILELVVDGLANGSMTQQLVGQRHQAVFHAFFELGDELHALLEQLLKQGLGHIASVAEQFAKQARHQLGQHLDIGSVARGEGTSRATRPDH